MRQRARSIALLLIISVSAYSGFGFACNKQNTLNQAAEAAKDIGGGTRDVIKAVGDAYQAKLITLEQKDRLADLLIQISKGGQKGVAAIEKLQQQGVSIPTLDQKQILNKLFDDEVISPFLRLLTEMGKLSESSAASIRLALASVRTAIVLLSNKIGRNDVILKIQALEAQNV